MKKMCMVSSKSEKIMHIKMRWLMVTVLSMLLSACVNTQSKYIMPPLKYNGPVSIHVPKTAYLYWQHGLEQNGEIPSFNNNDIIVSLIDAQDRKNNPSKYHLSYGKAQQASFITSFRDVLMEHHMFNDVEIITNPNQVKASGVLIDLKFKSTRVSGFERNYKITLTVEMKIKSGKSTFTRTYMTESDEGTFFNGKS